MLKLICFKNIMWRVFKYHTMPKLFILNALEMSLHKQEKKKQKTAL